jgi:hypothetical protein
VSHDLDDLERLLRAARPAPPAAFVCELERSLAGRPARKPDSRRVRVLVAGSGLAAGLAAVAVLLAVAGLLPSGLLPFTSSAGRARAGEDCRITRVERIVRRPYFVRDREGEFQVRFRVERVPRLVRRCR